jgi:hypothetical protein
MKMKKNHWGEFKKKYMQELKASDAVKEFIEKIKGRKTVTLLFASKNAAENHALILWNTTHGMVFDCYTGKPVTERPSRRQRMLRTRSPPRLVRIGRVASADCFFRGFKRRLTSFHLIRELSVNPSLIKLRL